MDIAMKITNVRLLYELWKKLKTNLNITWSIDLVVLTETAFNGRHDCQTTLY